MIYEYAIRQEIEDFAIEMSLKSMDVSPVHCKVILPSQPMAILVTAVSGNTFG